MPDRIVDAGTLWFTPAELGAQTIEYSDRAHTNTGLDWGIGKIDATNIQAFAGQMNFIIARPGNAKTTIAAFRARRAMKKILDRNAQDKECVAIVTLDQAAEEIYAMLIAGGDFSVTDLAWGRVSHARVVERTRKTINLPLRIVGKSTMRRSASVMTFDEIFKAIEDIEATHGLRPSHIMIDYIQIARPSGKQYRDRAGEIADAILRAEDLSYKYGASIDICAQAGRTVDAYKNKIPTLSDCQHTSAIEQAGYRVYSLWRPITSEPVLDDKGNPNKIRLANKSFSIDSDLLIMRQLKHKMVEAGYTYALKLKPDTLELNSIDAEENDELLARTDY